MLVQKKIINGRCWRELQTTKQSFPQKIIYQHPEFVQEILKFILILFNFS